MSRISFLCCLLFFCLMSTSGGGEPDSKIEISTANIRLAIPVGFKAVYSPGFVGGAPIHTFAVGVDCYTADRWGFINGNGDIVISPQWEDVGDFYDDRAAVYTNGKIGFIDPHGKMAIQPHFEKDFPTVRTERGVSLPRFYHGTARIGPDQYIDKDGKSAAPPVVQEPISPTLKGFRTQGFTEGLASTVVEVSPREYRTGYIDTAGKFVIKPIYYGGQPFHEGLASFQPTHNGPWGYLDRTGKVVIPPAWKWAEDFSEGLAVVENEAHLQGCIDHTGKVVIPLEWSSMGFGFVDGVIKVESSKEGAGVINREGKLIVPTQWMDIKFQNGYSFAIRLTAPMKKLSETSPAETVPAAAAWYNPEGKMIWHTP